jgi:RHS repeat-associated protein
MGGADAVRLHMFDYTYDKDGNRLTKSYYDAYGDSATLDFKGSGVSDAFDASNRLMEVTGNTGRRVNVAGNVSDIGSGIGSVWVTPNENATMKVQAEIVDGLWVAKGVELLDSANNSVYAIAYDDAGNTATDYHDTIALETTVGLYYKYDSKGNLTERGDGSDTVYMTYYQTGFLKQAANGSETETYHYNALGQRYMVVADNGTSQDTRTFVVIGSSVARELDDTITAFEYGTTGGLGGGIGSVAYSLTADDTVTFYSYNHKGDVYALVDANDNIAALYDYDGFGNIMTQAIDANVDNKFTFSTREFSGVSGLGHWPVREYDPFIGRWTRVDPAGTVDGLNGYVYVINNPLSRIDLIGHVAVNPDLTPKGGLEFWDSPIPPKKDPRFPGHLFIPPYNPPEAGEDCCVDPATIKKGKRTDPQATKGSGSWLLGRHWTINMQLDLQFEGPYNRLQVYWWTCTRDNGNTGIISSCTNKTTCNFDATTYGNSGGVYLTNARVRWLSCENGKWKKKEDWFSGNYTFDGKWKLTSRYK